MTGASGTASKVLRIRPFDRVDVADQVDVDLAVVQGGDQVGELVFGGAQEDRAFERFVEDRGDRLAVAVDRAGRALFAGAGACLNWTLVQMVLMWALSRNSECGRVTWARPMLASPVPFIGQVGLEGRVVAALGAALEAQRQLRLEGQARRSRRPGREWRR